MSARILTRSTNHRGVPSTDGYPLHLEYAEFADSVLHGTGCSFSQEIEAVEADMLRTAHNLTFRMHAAVETVAYWRDHLGQDWRSKITRTNHNQQPAEFWFAHAPWQ